MEQQKDYNTFAMLDWALFYREQFQWSVIPVSRDKKPLVSWTEYQKNLPSLEQIKE